MGTESTLARREHDLRDLEERYRTAYPKAPAGRDKSVLWADPGTTGRDAIANLLRTRGYFVSTADTSLDALKFIRSQMPDCCFLDMALQPLSGLNLLETLRRDDFCREMAVFIISPEGGRQADYENKLTQYYRGIKVLKKPVTAPVLLAELEALYPPEAEPETPDAGQ